MNCISPVFKQSGHKALIAYLTVGYPTIETTLKAVPLLADSGCDMIELGIPFSDPLADGVTIQNASYQALNNDVTVKQCLKVAEELNEKTDVPLLFMTYFNPVFSYGFEAFCKDCNSSGISGLIVPDLTPDEGEKLEISTQKNELALVYLLAPSSTDERIKLVAQKSRGFIYLVSITGVTGARVGIPAELETFVTRVRAVVSQPLCIGFGISTPEQARYAARLADGVIVGSRILQLIVEDKSLKTTCHFIRELREAIDRN